VNVQHSWALWRTLVSSGERHYIEFWVLPHRTPEVGEKTQKPNVQLRRPWKDSLGENWKYSELAWYPHSISHITSCLPASTEKRKVCNEDQLVLWKPEKKYKISIKQFLTVRCREVCPIEMMQTLLSKLLLKRVLQNPHAQSRYNRKEPSAIASWIRRPLMFYYAKLLERILPN